MSFLESVNALLASGTWHSGLAVVKGLRNGAVYGAKIRFPHALVMTFLFHSGSIQDKVRFILRATYMHSRNLASFVFIYKFLMALLNRFSGVQFQWHSLLAGFLGGYAVFGENNKINQQINLYLLSRIIMGLCKVGVDQGFIPAPRSDPFPLFGALVWAIVLWLFEHHRSTLQPSLRASMTYLYKDSDVFTSLRNFLLYNK
ncbi:peroxisomal membrane protein 4-like [Sycon ciliatum]|uniref:peroxisomal membrane protein 4-like n=1 Tax=Sycon ciliatum TaxID=27933 RepID=UPI0020AC4F84|eukprot:scpid75227/ scgid0369/ Peroxisomal membrane protein 4; 24 kDa peroxisomal intrinsic membrane protein